MPQVIHDGTLPANIKNGNGTKAFDIGIVAKEVRARFTWRLAKDFLSTLELVLDEPEDGKGLSPGF